MPRRERVSGATLRAWRKKLGLSQADVARLVDVDQVTISYWERPGKDEKGTPYGASGPGAVALLHTMGTPPEVYVQSKRRRGRPPIVDKPELLRLPKRQCPICNAWFQPERSTAIYWPAKCRSKAYRRKATRGKGKR